MNLYCDNIYSARELYSVGKYMSMMSLISFPQRFLINCPKYQLPNNVALYSLQWLLINYVTQIHIMKYTKQIYIFFKSASICVFTDNSIILTFDYVFFFCLFVEIHQTVQLFIFLLQELDVNLTLSSEIIKMKNLLIIIKAISLMLNLS